MTIRPLQITAGAIVGVFIGGLAVFYFVHDPIRRFMSDAVATLGGLTGGEARPSSPASEKEQQRQSAEQVQAKAVRDRQAQQLRADHQRAGGSEAVDAAARKERAWAQHYKKPTKCDGNPNNETMTECANDYIRSKQQFDRTYEARHGQGKQRTSQPLVATPPIDALLHSLPR